MSFTNTFSEEVSEENQYAYLQTFESDSVVDLSDENFVFSYAGDPKKDLLHSDQVVALQPILRSNLTSTPWSDGTTNYIAHVMQTPFGDAPDQFELDIGGVRRKLFIYDVTQDRFYFHLSHGHGSDLGRLERWRNARGSNNLYCCEPHCARCRPDAQDSRAEP